MVQLIFSVRLYLKYFLSSIILVTQDSIYKYYEFVLLLKFSVKYMLSKWLAIRLKPLKVCVCLLRHKLYVILNQSETIATLKSTNQRLLPMEIITQTLNLNLIYQPRPILMCAFIYQLIIGIASYITLETSQVSFLLDSFWYCDLAGFQSQFPTDRVHASGEPVCRAVHIVIVVSEADFGACLCR